MHKLNQKWTQSLSISNLQYFFTYSISIISYAPANRVPHIFQSFSQARLQLVGGNGFGAEIHHRGLVASLGLGALQHLPEEGLKASAMAPLQLRSRETVCNRWGSLKRNHVVYHVYHVSQFLIVIMCNTISI